MAQALIVIFLFIIAGVLFPPLLLVIPFLVVALIFGGLVEGAKGAASILGKNETLPPPTARKRFIASGKARASATKKKGLPPGSKAAQKSPAGKDLREVGKEFLGLVTSALDKGKRPEEVIEMFRAKWGINFSIVDGKLNVTDEALQRIAVLLPLISVGIDGLE